MTRYDVDDDDMRKLAHTVGVRGPDRRKWGHRNHFAAGLEDVASMERLVLAGLMVRGAPYRDAHFYHATAAGCLAAGMGRVTMRRCMRGGA